MLLKPPTKQGLKVPAIFLETPPVTGIVRDPDGKPLVWGEHCNKRNK